MKFTIDNSITIQIITCDYGAFLSIKFFSAIEQTIVQFAQIGPPKVSIGQFRLGYVRIA